MRYHWRSSQGKDILQRVYPRRHPTFSVCVLGRSWSVLSTSFNQIGAFSLSLFPHLLSLIPTVFGGTSTLETVLVRGLLWLADLGHAGDGIHWCSPGLPYVLLWSVVPCFFYRQVLIPGYNGSTLGIIFHCSTEELSEVWIYFNHYNQFHCFRRSHF